MAVVDLVGRWLNSVGRFQVDGKSSGVQLPHHATSRHEQPTRPTPPLVITHYPDPLISRTFSAADSAALSSLRSFSSDDRTNAS